MKIFKLKRTKKNVEYSLAHFSFAFQESRLRFELKFGQDLGLVLEKKDFSLVYI